MMMIMLCEISNNIGNETNSIDHYILKNGLNLKCYYVKEERSN